MSDTGKEMLLELENMQMYFPIRKGFFKRHVGDVKAVDGVTLTINKGETLGLVGESGSGKTTLGRLIVRAYRPTGGRMHLYEGDKVLDVATFEGSDLQRYWRKVQMIFQDPYSSLNSRRTVFQIIEEPLLCLSDMSARERRARVHELLAVVGLDPRHAERYPHAFSGGQRQRIGIARGMALNPALIVADEAVSALDVSIQGQIINLMKDLQAHYRLAYLFVSHDLGVVKHISDRIAVMYCGKLVEVASSDDLFKRPRHPYTEALLSAVPRPDPDVKLDPIILEGEVADPSNRPSGCPFHPRCRYAQERCKVDVPLLRDVGEQEGEHHAACHFAEDLDLKGAPEYTELLSKNEAYTASVP